MRKTLLTTVFALLAVSGLVPGAASAQPATGGDACPATRVDAITLPHVKATLARNHELLIVAFGSSSTTSWMASNIGHSYPAILQDQLNDRFPAAHVAVINRGIGGQGAAQELPRLDSDVLAIRPQLVIWQVGANDALKDVDPTLFRHELTDGIDRLRQAGIDVVLMDNQRSPRIMALADHDRINHILADVAAQTGAEFFDRAALMDKWQAEGFPYASFVAADHLHHNDRGYRCVADALATSIAEGITAGPTREAMQTRMARGG